MDNNSKSFTLNNKETELYNGLIDALNTTSQDITTRVDNLTTELEARAAQAAAQADAYEGDDATVHEGFVGAALKIRLILEEELGWLDVNITDAFREWQERLKAAFRR